jgi:uncharacterized membrane protein YgcG
VDDFLGSFRGAAFAETKEKRPTVSGITADKQDKGWRKMVAASPGFQEIFDQRPFGLFDFVPQQQSCHAVLKKAPVELAPLAKTLPPRAGPLLETYLKKSSNNAVWEEIECWESAYIYQQASLVLAAKNMRKVEWFFARLHPVVREVPSLYAEMGEVFCSTHATLAMTIGMLGHLAELQCQLLIKTLPSTLRTEPRLKSTKFGSLFEPNAIPEFKTIASEHAELHKNLKKADLNSVTDGGGRRGVGKGRHGRGGQGQGNQQPGHGNGGSQRGGRGGGSGSQGGRGRGRGGQGGIFGPHIHRPPRIFPGMHVHHFQVFFYKKGEELSVVAYLQVKCVQMST